MAFDLLIRNARIAGQTGAVDIAVSGGRIAAIGPGLVCEAIEEYDASGRLAFSGFVDSHIHLDKACILDRCTICAGTLAEAVSETAKAKAGFTQDDVYARAARVVEKAIVHGTNRMRTFVEVDPRAGMRSFEAIRRIKADYAFAIDIEICAFAQEGLTNEPETIGLLDAALREGADLLGGCPYTDPDPAQHIGQVFDLAERYGVAVDFHLDFDLDPTVSNLPAVIAQTLKRGYQGRVSIGHVTKLSAMSPESVDETGKRMAQAGIALTVLPSTDLFLLGRDSGFLIPRGVAPVHRLAAHGVTTSIATNNVLNPFTPYGDGSLIRMANLYANIAHLSRDADMEAVFGMVSTHSARLMGKAHGLAIGEPADIVVLDAPDEVSAVREIAPALTGWKNGVRTFVRPLPKIFR